MTDYAYAAFLSYSSHYAEWIEVLHQNLETCLEHLGASRRKVFFDQIDLAPGVSWISRLETGLRKSDRLIVVVTPEAMASPRVEDEWQTIIDQHRDWSRAGKILPVMLIWAPLPPFLRKIKRLDFTDASRYGDQMRKLVGVLLGRPTRQPPELSELPELIQPEYPESALPKGFRKDLVELLAPHFESRPMRKGFVGALNLKPLNLLEGYPSPELAVSALCVHVRGSDDELSAMKRLITTMVEELKDDAPEDVERLLKLGKRLEEPAAPPKKGLLQRYLEQVARDHERLVPVFQQRAELDLLDGIYVRLELRADPRRAALKAKPEERLESAMGIRQLLALDQESIPG